MDLFRFRASSRFPATFLALVGIRAQMADAAVIRVRGRVRGWEEEEEEEEEEELCL